MVAKSSKTYLRTLEIENKKFLIVSSKDKILSKSSSSVLFEISMECNGPNFKVLYLNHQRTRQNYQR